MLDLSVADLMKLGALFSSPSDLEIVLSSLLVLSLASLVSVWILFRRRLRNASIPPVNNGVESSEVGTQSLSDTIKMQAELRELVREFSALAEQVLQTVDCDRVATKPPKAGGAALQLIDLGLTPAEAARATEMTVGEVALLMNLRKARTSKRSLSDGGSMEMGDMAAKTTDTIDVGHGERVGVGGNGH